MIMQPNSLQPKNLINRSLSECHTTRKMRRAQQQGERNTLSQSPTYKTSILPASCSMLTYPYLLLGFLLTFSISRYLAGQAQYRQYDILPVISALNVILAAHPNRTGPGGGILVGRNRYFFASAATPVPLGGGLEAWRGFYSSVRPSHNQLMVNVNGKSSFLWSTWLSLTVAHSLHHSILYTWKSCRCYDRVSERKFWCTLQYLRQ